MPETTVPLGLLISRTGSYGAVGEAIYRGAMLAVAEVDRDPAFRFRFECRAIDPAGNTDSYVSGARSLLSEGDLIHVVGCYTSSSRKEVLPIFEKHDGLLWYPSHYEGFETAENIVYTGAAPNQHVVPLTHYMLRQKSRTVFMVGSNYIWAWENNRIMRELLMRRGGAVLGERYVPIGDLDLDDIVGQIVELRPDFIFNTLIGESAYAFFRLLREACETAGIDQIGAMPVVSCSLAEPELAMIGPACGGHLSSSVYYSTVRNDSNRKFVEAWKARWPDAGETSADAEAAYVAVHLLARAIARAGSTDLNAVLESVGSIDFAAPQGTVRIDAENRHCHLWPRIGRSQTDGTFKIIHESNVQVPPDPYLVWDAGTQFDMAATRSRTLRVVK